jgi:hypothetical protein
VRPTAALRDKVEFLPDQTSQRRRTLGG